MYNVYCKDFNENKAPNNGSDACGDEGDAGDKDDDGDDKEVVSELDLHSMFSSEWADCFGPIKDPFYLSLRQILFLIRQLIYLCLSTDLLWFLMSLEYSW